MVKRDQNVLMNVSKIKHFKDLLEERQKELASLAEISAESRDTVILDQQSVGRLSRMDAMQAQAMAQAQDRQRAHELMRIEQALTRIVNGDFGYCEECGEEINQKRLEVDPAALFCMKCASANES